MKTKYLTLGLVICTLFVPSLSFCNVEFDHQKDIVYGYKDGMALVMDIYSPKDGRNGAGIILVMSGGMFSSPLWSHDAGNNYDVQNLLKAGYVVFATAHSSQPKYTFDESLKDIPRAVRYIRYNSMEYNIDPQRIGILGYSSGGSLSLIIATSALPENQDSDDPIDKESSKVQAAIAYYPSTDFLNHGNVNRNILEHFHLMDFYPDASFDFHEWDDKSKRFERIQNPEIIKEYYRKYSPINFVSGDDSPILIIHGSDDKLVPIQQSEIFINMLKEQGVPCKLLIMPGEGHGWEIPLENEYSEVIGWFNQFLL